MPDPRFPNRPAHPDFARLSEIVQRMDTEAENRTGTMPSMLVGYVDADSAIYLATGRAQMACKVLGFPSSVAPLIAATFIDGLTAGIRFQQAGGTP